VACRSASKSARATSTPIIVLKGRIDGSKQVFKLADANEAWLRDKLNAAQTALFEKARAFRDANTYPAETYDQMKQILKEKRRLRPLLFPA